METGGKSLMLSEKIWAFWYWHIAAYKALLRLKEISGQVERYLSVLNALPKIVKVLRRSIFSGSLGEVHHAYM
jgi:hypothetical protein